MPLPTPRSDEEQSSFMERCMGSETMVSEYPDAGQRAAVCHRQWRTKKAGLEDRLVKPIDLKKP